MLPTDTTQARAEAAAAFFTEHQQRGKTPVPGPHVSYAAGYTAGDGARLQACIAVVEALRNEANKRLDEVETDMALIGVVAKMQALQLALEALKAQLHAEDAAKREAAEGATDAE